MILREYKSVSAEVAGRKSAPFVGPRLREDAKPLNGKKKRSPIEDEASVADGDRRRSFGTVAGRPLRVQRHTKVVRKGGVKSPLFFIQISFAMARPACRPEKRQPPRKVPSKER